MPLYDEHVHPRGGTHMLIPAGIPDPAKVRTSREVKSGDRNLSFSKSSPHGSSGISEGAAETSSPKALVLSTIDKVRYRIRDGNEVPYCSPL
jgi:hypothetical protein